MTRAGRVAQVVERLPGKSVALNSNTSTVKKIKIKIDHSEGQSIFHI
jgi:hypothetical protein